MEKLMGTIGGRKFVVTVGCGIATTFLCFMGKITGEIYATVTIATVGAFIIGHVTQEIKGGAKA